MSQSADRIRSIAEMPAQRPREPATAAQARGRFFNTRNAFNVQLPAVPDHMFAAEADAALDPRAPTGLFACDLSRQLDCAFPATTPLLLARYARIRPGETLDTAFTASDIICCVIRGTGNTTDGRESVAWSAGDLFILPGGPSYTHAADTDAVLWIVTNEPQLAFEHLRALADGKAPTAIVHFTAEEIERQIAFIYEIGRTEETPGSALIFSSEGQEVSRNILPTLTVAMNSLPGGHLQRPRIHNSVAVSLINKGNQCGRPPQGLVAMGHQHNAPDRIRTITAATSTTLAPWALDSPNIPNRPQQKRGKRDVHHYHLSLYRTQAASRARRGSPRRRYASAPRRSRFR